MNSKEMLEQEKENLLNGLISEELIYACLVTCEKTISTYAYKEKKYGNRYYTATVSAGESYKEERIKWMEYRKKLQSLLLTKHSMREIIQNTAFCASQWPLVRLPVATWHYEWPEVNRLLCVRS